MICECEITLKAFYHNMIAQLETNLSDRHIQMSYSKNSEISVIDDRLILMQTFEIHDSEFSFQNI